MTPIDITQKMFTADIMLPALASMRDGKTVTSFVKRGINGDKNSEIEFEVRIKRVGNTKLPARR